MSRDRSATGVVALALFLAIASLLRFMIGHGPDGLTFAWPQESTLIGLRATALLACLEAGAALSVSGLLLQVLLRNPLASPFILGLSSGAGLGMALAMWLAILSPACAWLLGGGAIWPATIGAIVALLLVSWLGRRGGILDPLTLVLAGVIVSSILSALMLLVQSFLPLEARGRLSIWMLGRVPEMGVATMLEVSGAIAAGGSIIAILLGRRLDAATLSDAEAASVGVELGSLRTLLLLVASLLAAAATALCGPLAFIGLVGPHLARLCCGPKHRMVAVGALLGGAALLVGADLLRQVIDLGVGRLQIGVLTALLGGPAFLILMRRRVVVG